MTIRELIDDLKAFPLDATIGIETPMGTLLPIDDMGFRDNFNAYALVAGDEPIAEIPD